MNITYTGKIIDAEPIQQGISRRDGTQWASQNYVIEELNQQYPSQCVFGVFGSDKLQQFAIKVGEVITVHLGIRSNKSQSNGRWFLKMDCWKVERFGGQQQLAPRQVCQQPQQTYSQQPSVAPPPQSYPPQQSGLPF